jgi:hypothetical protein
VPAVQCKQITRIERVQKRHFRIRKKVSVAVVPPSWQQCLRAAACCLDQPLLGVCSSVGDLMLLI